MRLLLPALGLVFITLKLLEITVVATWSWWLVLLPIYGPAAIAFAILLAGFIVALAAAK